MLPDYLARPDVRVAAGEGGAAVGAGRAVDLVAERACAALFLARLGSTRSWHLIALELGLPAWFAGQPAALHRRLVHTGRWLAFLADLDSLADQLQAVPPLIDYRTRRWLCSDPARLLAAVRAARALIYEVLPAELSDETLARRFWQVYTGGDLHLVPAPIGLREPSQPGYDVNPAAPSRDPAVPRPVLRTVQAVPEHDQVSTGLLLTWKPAACGLARLVGDQDHDQEDEEDEGEGELVRRGWALPDVVRAHGDYADDVALDVALAAAEEHGAGVRRLAVAVAGPELRHPRTDDNPRQYHHRVWSLRQALAHPQLHPQPVGHPAVDRALVHTSRRQDGHVEPWRLP